MLDRPDAVDRTKADPNRSLREDALVAEIEALRAKTAWQPISTYPAQERWEQGVTALLFAQGEVAIGCRQMRTDDPDQVLLFWSGEWTIRPTHWMPLPDPPGDRPLHA